MTGMLLAIVAVWAAVGTTLFLVAAKRLTEIQLQYWSASEFVLFVLACGPVVWVCTAVTIVQRWWS